MKPFRSTVVRALKFAEPFPCAASTTPNNLAHDEGWTKSARRCSQAHQAYSLLDSSVRNPD